MIGLCYGAPGKTMGVLPDGTNTVWNMGYVGMVYGENTVPGMCYGMCWQYGTGKAQYVVLYVGGMVRW